jgi:hypothetical protein
MSIATDALPGPGLDLIDPARVCYLPASSSPERPFQKGTEMVTLIDPILTIKPPEDGIELQPLREPESMVDDRMELTAVKRDRSFEWAGHRSGLRAIVRQMKQFGWTVSVREARPA